jgi:hypothetical protein
MVPRSSKKPDVSAHPDRHGIVSGIIIPPYFRPSTALLDCEKKVLRWPGPFDTGFLSPQPPGVVGIGPIRRIVYPHTGPTRVGPFSFWTSKTLSLRCRRRARYRSAATDLSAPSLHSAQEITPQTSPCRCNRTSRRRTLRAGIALFKMGDIVDTEVIQSVTQLSINGPWKTGG